MAGASACIPILAVCDWDGTACVIAQDVVSGNVHVGLCYGLHFFSSSAHKLDGLGKIKEHAPRFEHVHLHQDIAHICENHLQATLLPQLSKYAHASGVYLHCA